MKKLKVLIVLSCMLFTGVFFNASASASDFIVSAPDDFGMVADFHLGNGQTISTKLGHIYVNGKLTYCIEPLKVITSGDAMVPSSKLDANMRETLSVISHNGYNQTQRNSDKWYAATQIYMWEVLGTNPIVRGFDDYPNYRQQIQANINDFHAMPSFNNAKVTLEKGVAHTLKDTNNALPSFAQLLHTGGAALQRNGDTLVLTSASNAYMQGNITYKKVEDSMLGLPIVYQGAYDERPQSVIYPSISRQVEGNLTYRVQPFGRVSFTKRGEVLSSVKKESSPFGDVHTLTYSEDYLKDVLVGVYARADVFDVWGEKVYSKDQKVEDIKSTTQALQGKKLHAGTYYVKELKALDGYVLDTNEYDFEISKTNPEIDIRDVLIKNKRVNINLDFTKRFEPGSLLDLSQAYKDVNFGIYTKEDIKAYKGEVVAPKGSLVYTSGIDEKGALLKVAELAPGTYYLKELSTNAHFVLDETNYEFSVSPINESSITVALGNKGTLENKLHRNNLKIYKVDEKGDTPLQATFVLYDQNMKEISEFKTNEQGEYVFEGLVDGDYYIQEIEAPEGYSINGKLRKLTLHNDMSITIKNKKKSVVNASIETNDGANHKPFEISMVASMAVMYGFVLRRLKF